MFTPTEVFLIAFIALIFGGLLGVIIGEPLGMLRERSRQRWNFEVDVIHQPAPPVIFDARRTGRTPIVGRASCPPRRQEWN